MIIGNVYHVTPHTREDKDWICIFAILTSSVLCHSIYSNSSDNNRQESNQVINIYLHDSIQQLIRRGNLYESVE